MRDPGLIFRFISVKSLVFEVWCMVWLHSKGTRKATIYFTLQLSLN